MSKLSPLPLDHPPLLRAESGAAAVREHGAAAAQPGAQTRPARRHMVGTYSLLLVLYFLDAISISIVGSVGR